MKKRSLLLVLALVLVFVLVLATGCHQHSWGDWTIVTQPTETATGEAARSCACGEIERVTVPVLTDTSVWTLDETPATHETEGEKVYTSSYGTVTITTPKLTDHSYGSWQIVTKPTLEATGLAQRMCACGDTESVTLAVLSDESVWTKDQSSVAPSCGVQGKDVYTSQYGTVEVVLEALQHDYGTLVAEVAPNCGTGAAGVKAHWQCGNCGKLFVEVDGQKVEVTEADLAIEPTHQYQWAHDDAQHWQVCDNCSATTDKADHTWQDGVCTVCGADQPKGTLGNPYTVAEALEIAATLEVGQSTAKVYVRGVIISVGNYGNYLSNIYIADAADGTQMLVYSANLDDGIDNPYSNDVVVIHGYIMNYKGILEISGSNGDYPYIVDRTIGTSTISYEANQNASITLGATSGLNGETFTFTVTPNFGWKVDSVKVNGSVVAATDGVYTGTILGNTVVTVETSQQGVVQERDNYTVSFATSAIASDQFINNYTEAWNHSCDGVEMQIVGFNNGLSSSNWTDIRAGRKSDASVATIATTVALSHEITSVVVSVTQANKVDKLNENGFYLEYSTSADFASSKKVVGTLAVGDVVFTIPEEDAAANLYYRLVIDSAATGTNGCYRISGMVFNCAKDDHVHDLGSLIAEVPANCGTGETGIKAHWQCSICGKFFVEVDGNKVEVAADDLIIAAQHNLGDIIPGTATCQSAGTVDYRQCSECGTKFVLVDGQWTAITSDDQLQAESIPHNWVWVTTLEATCTREGREREQCSMCGEIHTDESGAAITRTVPKKDHSLDESSQIITQPDCINAGSVSYLCTQCGQRIVTQQLEATGHSTTQLLHWIVEPTLTEGGTGHFRCHCGVEWDASVPALSDSSVWTVGEVVVAQSYNNGEITRYNASFGSATVQTKDKLVAPWDNKVYYSVSSYIDEDGAIDPWVYPGVLTVGADNIGYGEAAPFRGKFVFTMVNAETGEFTITCYSIASTSSGSDDSDLDDWYGDSDTDYYAETTDAEIVYETEPYYTYTCWLDWETGVFTLPNRGVNTSLHIVVPSDSALSTDNLDASCWDTMMAISYTHPTVGTINIFSTLERVHFGVTFVDLAGQPLAAGQCATSNYVRVLKGDEVVASYARSHDGSDRLVVSDGLEGVYTNGDVSITLDGAGGITYSGAVEGSSLYTIAPQGSDYTISCIVNNVYRQISLQGSAYSEVQPTVDVTFNLNLNGQTADQAVENLIAISQHVPVQLPANLTHERYVFLGWYTDVYGNNPAPLNDDGLYVPSQSIVLYAKWATKVVVNLQGVLEGDPAVVYVGQDTVLVDGLPAYEAETTRTPDGSQYFVGWYFMLEGSKYYLTETDTITVYDSGITVIAEWNVVPAYEGAFYGTELWNAGYGNSSNRYITITLHGQVTSNISEINGATISSYDAETQVLSYTKSNGTTRQCYLDAETGVIAGLYSTNVIGNDYYILSKALTESNNKVTTNYGVYTAREPGSSSRGYYLQFVTLNTLRGEETLVLYNNHIYNNAVVQDALGNTLAVGDIKDSKTVVVTADGVVIAAVGAQKGSFSAGTSNTQDLDAYYGAYTCDGSDNLVLDGMGSFVWGTKSGTYSLVNAETSSFDLYVVADGANVEYYTLTLDQRTYVATKPMGSLTIQIVAPEGVVLPDSFEAMEGNINIALTLPDGEGINVDYVFNGFFADADCLDGISDSYTLRSEAETIYAKYSVKAVLTAVSNNGTDEVVKTVYSVGDIATAQTPVWEGRALVGWFLQDGSVTGEWGEQWINGTAISQSITVYAKWEDAPVFNQTYGLMYVSEYDGHGTDSYDIRTPAFSFDPYGTAVFGSSGPWPLNKNNAYIHSYNKQAGTLVINSESSSIGGDRSGFIDVTTGLIVFNYSADDTNWTRIIILVPGLTNSTISNYSESYWNNGANRAISFTVTVDQVATNYAIVVDNNTVHIGDTLTDGEGTVVAGADALTLTDLNVVKAQQTIATVHPCFTITLVVGNGFDNQQIAVLGGAIDLAPYQPPYTEGKLLTGWYTSPTFEAGTEFDAATANADVTIYGKWEESDPYAILATGSYAWTAADGVWSSGNAGVSGSTSTLTVMVYGDIVLTFTYGASGEGGSWDYLYISLNDTRIEDKICTKSSTIAFTTTSLRLTNGDVLTFTYRKDSGGNNYLDMAQVKDFSCQVLSQITLTYNFNVEGVADVVETYTQTDVVEQLYAVTESVNGKQFAGWYTSAQCADGEEFVAGTQLTESTTLYAKWVDPVVLTIVYGNGLDNATVTLLPGSILNLDEHIPSYTNGQVFDGWYSASTCAEGEEFVAQSISQNTTIWCKWVESDPISVVNSGSYDWTYADGIWSSTNAGHNSSKCVMTITALEGTTITFSYRASSENASRWDYFYYKVNGGAEQGATGGSGSLESKEWISASVTLSAGDVLELFYVKDSSSAGGDDMAQIKDLASNGQPIVSAE